LVGYIAFLDPPKESAGRALAAFAKHGVQVQVLTGDNEIVTRKIWREVGLPVERVVLGSEIESLTPVQLAELAEQAQVFAKLSPSQKAVIVTALQRKHHVVGFLSEGINDGPAPKTADVGIEWFGGQISLEPLADGGLVAHWNQSVGALLMGLGTYGSGGPLRAL
jgi:P-type Mg2+ transporter